MALNSLNHPVYHFDPSMFDSVLGRLYGLSYDYLTWRHLSAFSCLADSNRHRDYRERLMANLKTPW